MAICKPGRETSEDASPAHTLLFNFKHPKWETIGFCWLSAQLVVAQAPASLSWLTSGEGLMCEQAEGRLTAGHLFSGHPGVLGRKPPQDLDLVKGSRLRATSPELGWRVASAVWAPRRAGQAAPTPEDSHPGRAEEAGL